jgi:hypothetical protein
MSNNYQTLQISSTGASGASTYTRIGEADLLNGTWKTELGGLVAFTSSQGVINDYGNATGDYKKYIDNGTIKVGDTIYRNISYQGNLTWSCEGRTWTSNPPPYTLNFVNTTLTMSNNYQTLQINSTGTSGAATYTRQ